MQRAKQKSNLCEANRRSIGLFENRPEDYGINSFWHHLSFAHQKHLHCLTADKPSLDIRALALRFALFFVGSVLFKYIFIYLAQSGVIFGEIDILYIYRMNYINQTRGHRLWLACWG